MCGSGIAAGCGAPGSTGWKLNSEKKAIPMPVHHETLRMERLFQASLHRVFAAYVDTRAREVWSAPSDTAEVRIIDEDCPSSDNLRPVAA
jgi:hypothetical protein